MIEEEKININSLVRSRSSERKKRNVALSELLHRSTQQQLSRSLSLLASLSHTHVSHLASVSSREHVTRSIHSRLIERWLRRLEWLWLQRQLRGGCHTRHARTPANNNSSRCLRHLSEESTRHHRRRHLLESTKSMSRASRSDKHSSVICCRSEHRATRTCCIAVASSCRTTRAHAIRTGPPSIYREDTISPPRPSGMPSRTRKVRRVFVFRSRRFVECCS